MYHVDDIDPDALFPKGATTHGRSTRAPATGTKGMVASAHPYASRAGFDVLRDGGNAMDAAVAVASTLNIAEPYMSGVGGIGIALVYIAKENRTRVLNFSGHAPNAAQPDMYDHLNAETGPISPLVPGNVSGWMTMHDTYGSLPLTRVMRDAIQYADEGVALTPFNASMIEENLVRIDRFESSQKAVVVERTGLSAGSVFRLPQLAESLTAIAEGGQKEFYEGALGDRIQAGLEAAGGIISREELAAYRAYWQEPLSTDYRGFEVRVAPPNSSGFQILETLNILNNFDELPYGSSDSLHRLVEAVYIAADDRAKYAGDPAQVEIPLDRLLSAEYAADRAAEISMLETSGPPAERWDRSRVDHAPVGIKPEYASGLTTHFATADSEGNVVTITQTLGGAFGSAVVAGDTGIFMNNMCKWFDIDPGSDSPNLIGPGKQQDFCIAPAQIFYGAGDKKIKMSISTPGSWGILHTTAQMMYAHIDAGMNVQEAIEAPRFRHYDSGMLLLENRFPRHMREDLARRGHRVHVAPDWHNAVGGGQGIQFTEHGTMLGGADPRRDGVAMGY
ncbi:MAG TPA: gamma-glutamyltransferase [Dehalococcoidia bacterium]|nr:gamma-glutamyltransferase [Chloroflexota bacterium]MDP6056071.1 gamma-glutamyltransferase [Dehalococcoidia bacterium]MDP7261544.1 gamma-glutamyltransferase [Dehalococcoidia bacterium]HJP27902.1 gamma-glutamyltransferase [Dehalococcoidia bacterium]